MTDQQPHKRQSSEGRQRVAGTPNRAYKPRRRQATGQIRTATPTRNTRSETAPSDSSSERSSQRTSQRSTYRSSQRTSQRSVRQPAAGFDSSLLAGKLPLIIAGVVAIIVIIAVIFGIRSCVSGGQDQNQNSEQSEQAQAPADPRDADFALDPSRQDWNFTMSDEKVVYLTFDDGPSKNTQAVLDILDKYNAKATFFVIGHDPDHFDLISEAYKRGHTIGLHSYTHEYDQVYASVDAYFDDLEKIGNVVKEQIGYVPCFIRFPGGSSNTVSRKYSEGIMTELTQLVPQRGYQYYDWNLACGDGATVTTEQIIDETCYEPESSNIMILCHDAAAKDTTVEALPTIIEYYQERGYTFKAIDRSSWISHHGVNN